MCVVLRRGRARGISQGSCRVLHLTGLSQHLKHFQITPFLKPPPTPVRLSLRPQQLNWGPNANWMRASSSSSVQFPNYQLERLPGLMCYLHQIIFKWEKSTVCKWKVEEKKILPLCHCQVFTGLRFYSRWAGTNSFTHFDLSPGKLI